MSLFSRSADPAPAFVPIVYPPGALIPPGHRCASIYLGMILVLVMVLAAMSVMAVHLNSEPAKPDNTTSNDLTHPRLVWHGCNHNGHQPVAMSEDRVNQGGDENVAVG